MLQENRRKVSEIQSSGYKNISGKKTTKIQNRRALRLKSQLCPDLPWASGEIPLPLGALVVSPMN
jgi:hypothetical protein